MLLAGLLAPRESLAHKITVRSAAAEQSVLDNGGRLLADYGSFRLYEISNVPPAVVQDDTAEVRDDFNRIYLNAAVLDTTAPAVIALRQRTGAFSGDHLHLIQFAGPVQPAWHEALRATGVRIVSYVPQNAYLVYGDSPAIARLQDMAAASPAVQWDGEFAGNYKIHPGARLVDKLGRPQEPLTDEFAIQLVEDPAANPATLALIDRLKLEPVRRRYNFLRYVNVLVRLQPKDLDQLAAQPDVVSIQPYFEPRKLDERQDQIVAGNLTGSGPSGPGYLTWLASKGFTQAQFTSSGFVIDFSDSGIDNGTTTPNHYALYTLGNSTNASRVIYNRLEGTANNPGSTLEGCDGHGNINAHIACAYDANAATPTNTDAEGYYYDLGVCPFVLVGSSVIFDPANFTNPDYPNLQSEAYHDGARISNNSWGDSPPGSNPVYNPYNSDSQAYDALVRDAQPSGSTFPTGGNQEMVIIFSDGDGGPSSQSVSPPSTAKNVFSVGASMNDRSMTPANGGTDPSGNDGCSDPDSDADNADDIASFSSRGPDSDGRFNPDIVAPGSHITGGAPQNSLTSPAGAGTGLDCFLNFFSDYGNSGGLLGVCGLPGSGNYDNDLQNFFPINQEFFTESSGTSHSAPCVSGACALLRQDFINQAFTPPSPAMTKAYLMNSARYLTGPAADDTLPSNNQGMGALDLGMAFDGVPRILRDELSADLFTASGQTRVFAGSVNDPAQPFRVTLAWTDAPGNTVGNAIDNELTLTVFVNGKTYKGNVFSGATSVTGGSADHLNNVQSVFLPAGTSGGFTVTINAANINSDGVPGNGTPLDQDFALVIYNGDSAPLANFVPVAGLYDGLIQSNTPSAQTSGFLSVNTATNGAYTGKITFNDVSYSIKGQFDNNGFASSTITAPGFGALAVNLQIDLTNGTDTITGTVGNSNFTSGITAHLSTFNAKSNPTAFAGAYTVLLPPDPSNIGPDFPQGYGYGTLKVAAGGTVTFSATLGDGSPVSQTTAVIANDGLWSVYIPLYAKQGVLSGFVAFTNLVGVSDLGGTLTWLKPATATSKIYPHGFETQVGLIGSAYTAPAHGAPALVVSNANCNLLVAAGDGNLSSFVSNTVTLNSKITPCTNTVKLAITPGSGLFSGSFLNPANRKSVPFKGVLFQKQNLGAGFFLGSNQTGFVTLDPLP